MGAFLDQILDRLNKTRGLDGNITLTDQQPDRVIINPELDLKEAADEEHTAVVSALKQLDEMTPMGSAEFELLKGIMKERGKLWHSPTKSAPKKKDQGSALKVANDTDVDLKAATKC